MIYMISNYIYRITIKKMYKNMQNTTELDIQPTQFMYSSFIQLVDKKLKTLVGKYFKDFGYITDIVSYEILSHKISFTTGNILVVCRYIAECIFPQPNDIVSAKILNIHEGNIFCHYKYINILIPLSNISDDWVVGATNLHSKSRDRNYLIDHTIDVKIVMSNYHNGMFVFTGAI